MQNGILAVRWLTDSGVGLGEFPFIMSESRDDHTTRLSQPYLGVGLLSPPTLGSLALPKNKIVTALPLSANESLEGLVGGHTLLKPF